MKRTVIVFASVLFTGVLVFFGFAPPTHALQSDGLTEAVYCTVHGRILTLLQLEWEDRLAVAEASSRDKPEELAKKLADISAKYRSLRARVYGDLQTSETAFAKFGRENKDAIQQYLDDHHDVAAAIDDVKTRVDGLIQQFESRMQSRTQDSR